MKASVSIMLTDDHGKLIDVYRGETVPSASDFALQKSLDSAKEKMEENESHIPQHD